MRACVCICVRARVPRAFVCVHACVRECVRVLCAVCVYVMCVMRAFVRALCVHACVRPSVRPSVRACVRPCVRVRVAGCTCKYMHTRGARLPRHAVGRAQAGLGRGSWRTFVEQPARW